jgi:hypothetical protein
MGPSDTAFRRHHYVEPKPGTTTRLDGSPANMLDLKSYPVMAECLVCGELITCDNYLISQWRHVEG